MINTSPCNAEGAGSTPGQEAKIAHVSQPKKSNIKQKKYCNKFNKDLKKSICVFKTLNGLLRWLGGKSPPTSAVAVGDPGSILGQEDPLEE